VSGSPAVTAFRPDDALALASHRHRDALFIRHHRAAERHLASAGGTAAEQNLPIFDFLLKLWQYREGHDLSIAGRRSIIRRRRRR